MIELVRPWHRRWPSVLALTLIATALPLCVLPTSAADTASPAPAPVDPLSRQRFLNPPREAGVHVWWHWLDGAISREGITKDLETMKAQGVVQATILNVGLFDGRELGVPRVPFASREWFSMFRWALDEARRVGVTVGVHNCDGWSSSGGPWITPELSMKQLVWTKTFLTGGQPVDLLLPQPAEVQGFYRDVAVVAYRTAQRESAFRTASPRLHVNDVERPAGTLLDGCPMSALPLKQGDRFVFSAPTLLLFDRVALHPRRPFMWGDPAAFSIRLTMETSSDGREYARLTDVTVRGLNRTALVDVPHASAPFVRFTVAEMSDVNAWIPVELGELELLRPGETPAYSPTIPFVAEKTGSIKAAREEDVYTTGAEDTPRVAPADVVVLTAKMDADGRLRWNAPAGSWAILRFGYTSTGATNAPATREGLGLECDKLDPAAVEHHFRSFPDKLIAEAGDHAGTTLRFLLVDSWECGFQTWTARFPVEFERRRGYSLTPYLPALAGETVGSVRESEAALYDFRRTIADLIRESYYERLATLCHERQLELHAEVIYGGAGYPPLDVLRSTQRVDLPMFEFWAGANRDAFVEYTPADAPELNLPACAAAGYGKPLMAAEAYTGFAHYSESPADLKPFGDRAFCAGINRMILHSSVHQPTDDKPGMTLGQFASHFNRNNLYWPRASEWMTYQARIQWLLGQGTPAFDVLYYLGDQLPQYFVRNASTTLPFGYALTAVNADILAERIVVRPDGRLRLNGVSDAALLSLPPQPYMALETLKRLETLVRAGAHVYGPKPLHTLSMADTRQRAAFEALADRLWGKGDGRTPTTHPYGKGSVMWGQPIGAALAELRVAQDFAATPAGERDFLFVHRRLGDVDVYFVTNQQNRVLARECSFRVGEKTPEIWDPETGAVTRPAAFRIEGESLRLPVRFQPRQALLFVFRPDRPSRFVTSISRGGAPLFPTAGGTESDVPLLTFDAAGVGVAPATGGELTFGTSDGRTLSGTFHAPEGLPIVGLSATLELRGPGVTAAAPFPIADLRSLTEYEAPEVRYFSGEAVYRFRFSVPDAESVAATGDAVWLALGDFETIAEITLNGHSLGRAWKPGTEVDVASSLQRENELVVTVVNVYRNRFIGDLALFGEVRNLRTSSPIKDFLSRDKPLKRSGLLGPLKLTRISRQRVPGF